MNALLGCTGFVGSYLQTTDLVFDGLFHRPNIHELPERSWDHVICAGAPAEKWRANQDPTADKKTLKILQNALARTDLQQLTLISTVDVFDPPVGVSEEDSPTATQPYGRHRAELEAFALEHFAKVRILRLPALFGPGLRKNALYDLLNDKPLTTPANAIFQWYNIEHLPSDIVTAWSHEDQFLHLVTEPLALEDLAGELFPDAVLPDAVDNPPRYMVGSDQAAIFRGQPYWRSRPEVLAELAAFVRGYRRESA